MFLYIAAALVFAAVPTLAVSAEEVSNTEEAGGSEANADREAVFAEEAGGEDSSAVNNSVWPVGPDVTASSAILIDAATGLVLYEKDADAQHYPASITKILTTLLALENSSLDETVVFSSTAVYENEGETSNIARDVGEEMTMEQTLYAVMLESANECAYAAAEHVGGGDYQAFIDMMNERAQELGCTNTHFVNANGLHDDDHYTSCRDMALIAQDAIANETFRRIIGTRSYIIPPTNKHDEETPLNNHHRMINAYRGAEYLYDYCIGGKTGYTEMARNTLVTYAEKDNLLLICVVMETENPYDDTIALLNFGFDNYAAYNVSQNETRYGTNASAIDNPLFGWDADYAEPDPNAEIVLPVSASFEDTEVTVSYDNTSGSVFGTLIYSYGGREVGSVDIVSSGTSGLTYAFGRMLGDEENEFIEYTDSARPLLLRVRGWSVAVKRSVGIVLILAGLALVLFCFRWEIANYLQERQNAKRYKTIRKNRRW